MEYKIKIIKGNLPEGISEIVFIYSTSQELLTEYLTSKIGQQNIDWEYL